MNNVQHSQRKWQTNRLIFSISIPALGFYVLSIVASVYESVPTTTTTQYQYVPTTHKIFMKVYPPVPTTTTHQTFITLLSRRGSQRQVTEMGEYIFKVSFIILSFAQNMLYIFKVSKIILSCAQNTLSVWHNELIVGWFVANWRGRDCKMWGTSLKFRPNWLSIIVKSLFTSFWYCKILQNKYCYD